MIVNTQRLFRELLSRMQISVICDVGSMNGTDALAMRAAAPRSRLYAFEPNPLNLRTMVVDRSLQERNIEIVSAAASDHDGEADFFLVAADYSQCDPRRGMSSLYQRTGEWAPANIVRVRTVRLDTFLADKSPGDGRLALWIDTEGAAYEVIEGVAGVAGRVDLVHVEVETEPCIGLQQKLYPQVKGLLRRLGFTELATDQPSTHIQFNALFVRRGLSARMRLTVRTSLVWASLRRLLGGIIVRSCPACARCYQAMRARASRAARCGSL
jgi:FkbM family methyltransferase